jgi:hypothetical protein
MSKPTFHSPDGMALERILKALEDEIVSASDDEIAEVLAELGMKLGMKGSAATADIRLGWAKFRYGFDLSGWRPPKERQIDDEEAEGSTQSLERTGKPLQ